MVNTTQNAETRTNSATSGKDASQSTATRKIEIENNEAAPMVKRLLRTRRSRTVQDSTSNSNQKQSIIPMVQCKLPLDRINDILSKIKKTELSNVIEKSDSLVSDLSVQTDSNSITPNNVNSEITTNVGNLVGVETTLNKNVLNSPNRIMCLFCDRTFVSNILLQKHTERSHHISTTRRFSSRNLEQSTSVNYHPGCNFCSKNTSTQTATNLSVLFNHLLDEHAVKYFACRNCEIRFSTKDILISHNRDVHGIIIDNTAESLLSDGNCINRERSDLGADLSNSTVIDKVLQLSQELNFNLDVSQNECSKNILFPPKLELNNIDENIIIANENFENEKKGKAKAKKSILKSKSSTVLTDQKEIEFFKQIDKSKLSADNGNVEVNAENLLLQHGKVDEHQSNKKVSIEQNAVIILDDINLDNKLFKNKNVSILSQLHVKEEKDNQILSRLGIAQNRSSRARSLRRSRKTPHMENRASSETPRKDKVKAKGDSHDFVINKNKNDPNSKFDPDFYSSVSVNVRENLLKYLDGKLGRENDNAFVPDLIDPKIKSTHAVIQATSAQPAEIHGSDVNLNAITVFPTLLTSDQYGSDKIPDYSYGANAQNFKKIITKNSWKWKWDPIKKYKYCNEDGKIVRKIRPLQHVSPRDLSKLDIWTQLTMREKFEKSKSELPLETQSNLDKVSRNERQKQINELNMILDRRLFPNIEKECSRFGDVADETNIIESNSANSIEENIPNAMDDIPNVQHDIPNAEDDIPNAGNDDVTKIKCEVSCDSNHDLSLLTNLGLIQNSTKDISNPLPILSGEWVRPRCYICCICGRRADCLRLLEAHQASQHPHVNATHYEIVGQELLDTEAYKYLYLPGVKEKDESVKNHSKNEISIKPIKKLSNILSGNRANKVLRTTRSVKSLERGCTKCEKMLLPSEFYRHILECAGDYGWIMAKKKCKYKPFGARRRRLKGLYKREVPQEDERPESKEDRNIRPKLPPRPRTKPSDAETIQRMLANLPAKRSTRQNQDMPSSKSKSNSSERKPPHVRRLLDSPGNGKRNKIISSNLINSMKSALGKKVRHITRSLSNNQMPNIDNHNEETVPKDVVLPDNTDSLDKKYSNYPKVNDDQVKLLDELNSEVNLNLNQEQNISNEKNTPTINIEPIAEVDKRCLIPNEKTRNRSSTYSKNDVSSAVNKCSDFEEESDKPIKKSLRRRPVVSSKIINNLKSTKVSINKENVSSTESNSSKIINDINSNVSSETDTKITQPKTKKKRKPVKFPLKWIGNKKVHFSKSKRALRKQLKNNIKVDSEKSNESPVVNIETEKSSDNLTKPEIENENLSDNPQPSVAIINNEKNEENLADSNNQNDTSETQSNENEPPKDEEKVIKCNDDLHSKISPDAMAGSLSNQDLSCGSFSSSNNGMYNNNEMYSSDNRRVRKNSQYDGNETTKTFGQHLSNSTGYNSQLLARGYNYNLISNDDQGINEPIRGPNNAYYTMADNIDKPPLLSGVSDLMNHESHKNVLQYSKLDNRFPEVSISLCPQSYPSSIIEKNESYSCKSTGKSKQVKSKRGLNDCIAMLRGKLGEKSSDAPPEESYPVPTIYNDEYNDDTSQPLDLSGRIPQPEDLSMKSAKASKETSSNVIAAPSMNIAIEKPLSLSNTQLVSKPIYDPILKIPHYSLNQSTNVSNAHLISIPCTLPTPNYMPEPNKRVKCDFSIPSLLSPDKKVTSHSTINSLHYPQMMPEINCMPEKLDHCIEHQSFKQKDIVKLSEMKRPETYGNLATISSTVLKSEKHPKQHFIDDILSTKKTNTNEMILTKSITRGINPQNNYSSISNDMYESRNEMNLVPISEVIEHVNTDLFLIDPVTGMITERVTEKETDSNTLTDAAKRKSNTQNKTRTRKYSTANTKIPGVFHQPNENLTETVKTGFENSPSKLKTSKTKSYIENPIENVNDFSDNLSAAKINSPKKNAKKNQKKSSFSTEILENAAPLTVSENIPTNIIKANTLSLGSIINQDDIVQTELCYDNSEKLATNFIAVVNEVQSSEKPINEPSHASLSEPSKPLKKRNRKLKESNFDVIEDSIITENTLKKKVGRKSTKQSITPPPIVNTSEYQGPEIENEDLNATPNYIKPRKKSKASEVTSSNIEEKVENNPQINTRNDVKIKFYSEKILGDCTEKVIINESEFALTPTNNRDLITNDKILKCENLSKPTLEIKEELIMKGFSKKNRSKAKIHKKMLLDQIEDTSNSFSNNDISGAAIAPGELSTNDIQDDKLLNKTISNNDNICTTSIPINDPIESTNEDSDDDICLAEMAKKKTEISSASVEHKTLKEDPIKSVIESDLNAVHAPVLDENKEATKIEIPEIPENNTNTPILVETGLPKEELSKISDSQIQSDTPINNETSQIDSDILKIADDESNAVNVASEKKKSKSKNVKKHATVRKSGRLSTYKDFKGEKIATINSVQLSENGHLIFKMQKDDGSQKQKEEGLSKADFKKAHIDQNYNTDSEEIKSLTSSDKIDDDQSFIAVKRRKGRSKASKAAKKSFAHDLDSTVIGEDPQSVPLIAVMNAPLPNINGLQNKNITTIDSDEKKFDLNEKESSEERKPSENLGDPTILLKRKIPSDSLLDNISNLFDENKSKDSHFLHSADNEQTSLDTLNVILESKNQIKAKVTRSSKRKSKSKTSESFSNTSSDSQSDTLPKDIQSLPVKTSKMVLSTSSDNDIVQNTILLQSGCDQLEKITNIETEVAAIENPEDSVNSDLIKTPSYKSPTIGIESLENTNSDNIKNYDLRKSRSKKHIVSHYDNEAPQSSDNLEENIPSIETDKKHPFVNAVTENDKPNKSKLKMQIKLNKSASETAIEDNSNSTSIDLPKLKRSERKKYSTESKNITEENIQNEKSDFQKDDNLISKIGKIDEINVFTHKKGRNKKTRKPKKVIIESTENQLSIVDKNPNINSESKVEEHSITKMIQSKIDFPVAVNDKNTPLNKNNCLIDETSKLNEIENNSSKQPIDNLPISDKNIVEENQSKVNKTDDNTITDNEKPSDSDKSEYLIKHKKKGRKSKQTKDLEDSTISAPDSTVDIKQSILTVPKLPSSSSRRRNKRKSGSSIESTLEHTIQADSKIGTETEILSQHSDVPVGENSRNFMNSDVIEEQTCKFSKHIEKSKSVDNVKSKIKKSKKNSMKLKDRAILEEEIEVASHKTDKDNDNNKKSNNSPINTHANINENYEIVFNQTSEKDATETKSDECEDIVKRGSKKSKSKHKKGDKSFISSTFSSNLKKLKKKHYVANNNDNEMSDIINPEFSPQIKSLSKNCLINVELPEPKKPIFDFEQSNSEAENIRSKIYDIDEDMDFKVDEPIVKIKNKHKKSKQNIYVKKSRASSASKLKESDVFDYNDFDSDKIKTASKRKHSLNKKPELKALKEEIKIVNHKISNHPDKIILETQEQEINDSNLLQSKKKKTKNNAATDTSSVEVSCKNKKKFKNQFLPPKENVENTYGSSDIENSYATRESYQDKKNIILAKKDDKQCESKFSVVSNNKNSTMDDGIKISTLKKSATEDIVSKDNNSEEKEFSTSESVNTNIDSSSLNDKPISAVSTHDIIENKNHHDSTFDNLFSQKEKDHLKQVKIINNIVDKHKNKDHYEFDIKKKCERLKSIPETITKPVATSRNSSYFDIASQQKTTDNMNLSESDKESLKQEKYLADFGMFTEKRPRKSTILAIKKINQTFKPDSSDTDDSDTNNKKSVPEFRQCSKPLKKRCKKMPVSSVVITDSNLSENDMSQNIDNKSMQEFSPMTDSDVASFSEGSSIPLENKLSEKQETYCLICRRKFRKPENLLKHQTTLTHIAKLSEIEVKENKTKPVEFESLVPPKEDPKELLIEINQNENVSMKKSEIDNNSLRPYKNLAERKSFDHEMMPHQTLTTAEISSPKIYSKCAIIEEKQYPENIVTELQVPTEMARKELSRDEALFFECCSLLKGSETNRKQVTESEIYKPQNKDLTKTPADKLAKDVENPIVTYNLTVKNILQASEIVPEPLTKDSCSQTLHVDIPEIKILSPEKEMDNHSEEYGTLANRHSSEIPVIINKSKNVRYNQTSKKSRKTSSKKKSRDLSDLDEFSEPGEPSNEDIVMSPMKGDLEDTVESSPYCLESLIVRTNSNDFSDNADSLISSKDLKNHPSKSSLSKEVKMSHKLDSIKHSKYTKNNPERSRKNRKKTFTVSSGEESDKNINCNHRSVEQHSTPNVNTKVHNENKKTTEFNSSIIQNPFIEFEDKFDKIKRKAREKAQAAQEALAAAVSSKTSSKNRKKSHSKSRKSIKGLESSQKSFKAKNRRVSKKKHHLKEIQKISSKKILTKGARKVFDSIKVSTPTDEIHSSILDDPKSDSNQLPKFGLHSESLVLSENSVSNEGNSAYNYNKPKPSKKIEKHESFTKSSIDKRLAYETNYGSGGDNSLMQDFDDNQNMDIYEFLDEDEDKRGNRNFKFSSPHSSGADKNVYGTKKGSDNVAISDKNTGDVQNEDSQISSLSFSDRDDFNYASEDYNRTGEDTNMSSNSMEDINALIKFNKKNRMFRNKKVTKKSAIMGRIFKNNAIRNDLKSPSNENSNELGEKDNTFSNRSHLDQLFDSLLEKNTSNAKLPSKTEDKVSCELSELTDYCSTQDDIICPKIPNSHQDQDQDQDQDPSKESGSDFEDSDTMDKSIMPIRKNSRKIIPRLKARSSDDETSTNLLSNNLLSTNLLSTKDISDNVLLKKGACRKMYSDKVGVAGRKSQRKCTTGKQNVLVESWSSESDFEDFRQFEEYSSIPKSRHHRRPRRSRRHEHKLINEQNVNVEARASSPLFNNSSIDFCKDPESDFVGEVDEYKDDHKKDDHEDSSTHSKLKRTLSGRRVSFNNPNVNAMKMQGSRRRRKPNQKPFDYDDEFKPTRIAEPLATQRRNKRSASEMLYYWSSSSDEEPPTISTDSLSREPEPIEQHGWIVGDSHKKLVTMLAHAKGRKLDDKIAVKEKKTRIQS